MPARRGRVPAHLRAIYQLLRKYPGVSNQAILEMTSGDDRLSMEMDALDSIGDLVSELRQLVVIGEAPEVVGRTLRVHDRMSRAGLGDAFRYIVRSVERGEYFGLREIQTHLGRGSNSFQRKFNTRISEIAPQYPEIGEVYNSWLRLRYMSNPIVQLNLEEW